MLRKNKIVFVTPFYLPVSLSGSGLVIKQYAESLANMGYDCSIITANGYNTRWWYDPFLGKQIRQNFNCINGVKIYRLPCLHIASFISLILVRYLKIFLPKIITNKLELHYCGPHLIGLSKLLKQQKFDIIYSSPLPAYINKQVIVATKNLAPKPKIILGSNYHEKMSDFKNSQLQHIFNIVDKVHVSTKAEINSIQQQFNVPSHKFIHLPYFISQPKNEGTVHIKQLVEKFSNKYGLSNKKVVLFAGSKIKPKGAYVLLQAMNQLYKQDNSYRLIAIGNSTPHWNEITNNLKSKFLIDLGFVDDHLKETVFEICNLYCMPSICESFGLTYLEAWYKKKPVIGAYIPPVREIIQQAKGGLLIESGNTDQLVQAIYILTTNKELNHKLGLNGYKTVLNTYSEANIMHKFKKLMLN